MVDQRIIDDYMETHSVKDTASNLGISVIKVRRTLITVGLWSSRSSKAVGELLAKGLSTSEIAQQLSITEKAVEAYSPYKVGQYNAENKSSAAKRCEIYRMRKRQALDSQITPHIRQKSEEASCMTSYTYEEVCTVHLHLELAHECPSNAEIAVLKAFGKVEEDRISRDVLVPSSMTLHALHYVIQQVFGWQNSHLHHFSLPEEVYEMCTKNSFYQWGELCGVYFRMPSDDYEDLYWDDDYDGSVSFRSWLRRKYRGPYVYEGCSELCSDCQRELAKFYKRWPQIEIRVPFDFLLENPDGTIIEKVIAPQDATIDEMERSLGFGYGLRELLERLTLGEILILDGSACPKELRSDSWDAVPITDTLHYLYDYGDGWEVKISVVANSPYAAKHPEVAEKECPICIAQDGLGVMDDVGGIHGYCELLISLHGDNLDTRAEMKEWARMQGWTGRRTKTENML